MSEVEYWTQTLNDRAKELGMEQTVQAVQPGVGEGYAIHWVIEMDGQLVELGWNVEEAERGLRGLAMQKQMMNMEM